MARRAAARTARASCSSRARCIRTTARRSRPTCAGSATSSVRRGPRSAPTAAPTSRRCGAALGADAALRRARLPELLRRASRISAARRRRRRTARARSPSPRPPEPLALGAACARRAARRRHRGRRGAELRACRVATAGPGVGLFATARALRAQHARPLVGETVDARGRRGYVLTLATREQHIRRERATSNICTNQGLCALAVTVYLSLLGRNGLARPRRGQLRARARRRRAPRGGRRARASFGGPFFNEFVVRAPDAAARWEALARARGWWPASRSAAGTRSSRTRCSSA